MGDSCRSDLCRRAWGQITPTLRRLVEDYADGIISLDQLTASVQGWINHVRYSNSVGLRKAVLRRAIIPKQQKRKQL